MLWHFSGCANMNRTVVCVTTLLLLFRCRPELACHSLPEACWGQLLMWTISRPKEMCWLDWYLLSCFAFHLWPWTHSCQVCTNKCKCSSGPKHKTCPLQTMTVLFFCLFFTISHDIFFLKKLYQYFKIMSVLQSQYYTATNIPKLPSLAWVKKKTSIGSKLQGRAQVLSMAYWRCLFVCMSQMWVLWFPPHITKHALFSKLFQLR